MCEALRISEADGAAFVEKWEAEEGERWSELTAETASIAKLVAVEEAAEAKVAAEAELRAALESMTSVEGEDAYEAPEEPVELDLEDDDEPTVLPGVA